jgi:uncharacterized protein YkwD
LIRKQRSAAGGRARPGALGRGVYATILALTLTALVHPAQAALPDAINAIRLHGCGGRAGSNHPLRTARKLDEAARRTAAGAHLHDALLAAGYGAEESAAIHVATPGGDLATARLLEQHFCAQISEPLEREIGIAQRGDETWVVLAAPLAIPQPQDAAVVSRRVLELVNAARGQARLCGRQSFNATTPLRLSAALGNAALAHSLDMATRDYFDHAGRDGSTPASRVTRAGYEWRVVGENLAAGVATPEEAVAGWLQSPPHCQNLMDARFTDMGVGYRVNPQDPSVIFWTQVFAQALAAPTARATR